MYTGLLEHDPVTFRIWIKNGKITENSSKDADRKKKILYIYIWILTYL